MFELTFSSNVDKAIKKHFVNNNILMKKLSKTIQLLSINPKHNSLKSHKVDTKNNDEVWSSSVTGDWRIIWEYDEDMGVARILCLELGTHSGGNGVYR
jgi:mRNA-degrading endonuclease YafQ of YafQ-DinJ toxin-antitoxin module